MTTQPGTEAVIFTISSIQSVPLEGKLFRSRVNRKGKTILYLHGGGLLYGDKNDLPEPYLNLFLSAGYDFFALDYPLAPETKLPDILASIQAGLLWFQSHAVSDLSLDSADYLLFGRSAGAYLAFLTASSSTVNPAAIISLYGYHTLREASFRIPNRHYLAYQRLVKADVERLLSPVPIVTGEKELRFALYVYARQSGTWLSYLLDDIKEARNYSLNDEQLAALPPTYLAASNADPDVPYQLSKILSQKIPFAKLNTIASEEHDFDRNLSNPLGIEVYRDVIVWLDETLTD
ncbi:alpha/beta hydrolase [Trichococcus collinsii]|uniref:Acetyl esterase/lipase n=1 Tax=Trichococcus collinsii TaxID=157076 RepID=A0AB38A289_9LACT|nr:alpha/beta hydrolase [Trichococcus collinsii]CZR05416.1 alpha/beta hydrolase fold [Trichococcus collinsii]SEA75439.1 Acetyl esterase/lipase [Trichococcus collinsii]